MSNLIVTSGQRFTDIDALACVIAYAEIPEEKPILVIPGPLNLSITNRIRSWPLNYLTFLESNDYEFVIVDVSETSQLAVYVDVDRVIEIYDHHFGFEDFWIKRLGDKAKIEEIGACATLIWEEFKKRNPQKQISTVAANLLYTAINSNTLDFRSSLATERDKKAFEEIKPFTNLPEAWVSSYYLEIESLIHKNPSEAIKKDTKIQNIRGVKCAVGQLELWNSRHFLQVYANLISATLKEFGTELWFFTSPCISEGRNYIYTKSKTIKDLLSSVMDIQFEGDLGLTTKLWLRKEILKMIQ